jgi:archaellum component FlaG (FlaF/FlaG flagellin family)
MAGEASQQLIFFIAAVGAAVGFIAAAGGVISIIEGKMEGTSRGLSHQLAAEITVVSVNTTGTSVLIYAENTGRENLDINETMVMIDGSWIEDVNLNINVVKSIKANSVWEPAEILELDCTVVLDSGWHGTRVQNGGVRSILYEFER